MSASQNAPPRAHRRVVRDVPIVRQPGLNVTGDVASQYCMEYTYLPLCGAEKSHQEYTDGVVFRDETMGVQKSTTRRYKLPPVRPPRELLMSDPEPTPLATTTPPSASSTVARATCATVGPLVNEQDSKTVVKDAKNYVVVETLNNQTTVVGRALTDACSLIITKDSLRKLWVDENLSALYKTIITPMSTILNRFKQSVQDLVEILYSLQLSIWTDLTAQINHTKSTVTFLIRDDSLNYIFGNSVMTVVSTISWHCLQRLHAAACTSSRLVEITSVTPVKVVFPGNAGYILGQFNTFPTKPGPAGPMGCQGSFLMKNYPHI
ncbi:uncharacterized protein F5891DRAFT_987756 [Suillus fuscotomentosus]|uniref:Uncharacterized protein n=1 Tax=Suillus fuscotomentosus TaxID=1912939 RepID=A0AAD4DPV0_9AGAM|nr:uncharacterized protein F5891DRAFT_987756 [Suillus fuscotomentosus]KAG1888873.1 hypothetical protein F5891DRAFT_987756 [Suillus fuscotomentosus]